MTQRFISNNMCIASEEKLSDLIKTFVQFNKNNLNNFFNFYDITVNGQYNIEQL